MISFNENPLLIDVPKYQQGSLGFVVLALHVLYNTSGPALGVILYCFAGQI